MYDTACKEESSLASEYVSEKELCLEYFEKLNDKDQTDLVKYLLSRMHQYQLRDVHSHLNLLQRRDFISLLMRKGLDHVAENILSFLDAQSLYQAELVCKEWRIVISRTMLFKKLIERKVNTYKEWHRLAIRRNWIRLLFQKPGEKHPDPILYKALHSIILIDLEALENNWRNGEFSVKCIDCRSDEINKGVYCLQYDDYKIVSGLKDNTIKIWDRNTLQCTKVLTGHTGSVLCLQYEENIIITGSSDSTIRVWNIETGELLNMIIQHSDAVLHLRFSNNMMVSCSKDRLIAVWNIKSPADITLRTTLVGHQGAVNAVDMDDKYIVSASGDRTIKIWKTSTCEFVRTLRGHDRGIACLQYKDNLIVSGSSDKTIRLWDIESGNCLRVLEGHQGLVRCLRFDEKRIVSGDYEGEIKIWDLAAALNSRSHDSNLCLRTLKEHRSRVFRIQFDELQIISSSYDDAIVIRDLLDHNRLCNW